MTGADFQRQALIRKFVYFGIILVLFLVTLGVRANLDAQAEKLSIRDQDLGEGDLTGQAVRLSLVGSRGITITCLWAAAQEKQKKHEWNELELIVRSLTKLQPHFIAPWRFQSWNLAYNVSVESDRVKDKYFYITRGIDLAAEGERSNRSNPDLRLDVGYFLQDKIGISDENSTFRCLFQLSLIDPLERSPVRFRSAGSDQVDNMVEFRDFCEKHPMLIRRMRDREHLNCYTPELVVDFLEANQRIPSRYEDVAPATNQEATPLKPVNDRFPPLPPVSRYGSMWNELSVDSPSTQLGDSLDNFGMARAWFCYSQDPLDPNEPHPRSPRLLSTVIFKSYPARAQHYLAERLEAEGWYDDTGWEIRDWQFPDKNQPQGPRNTITVGKGGLWAVDAWEKAFQMTKYRGENNEPPLMLDDERLSRLSPQERHMYNVNRNLTNYYHFYIISKVEGTLPTVTARRLFHQAETLDSLGDYDQAKPVFEDPAAMGPPDTWGSNAKGWAKTTGWKKILLDASREAKDNREQKDPSKRITDYPDYAEQDEVQEQTFIFEHKYKHTVHELSGSLYKQLVVMNDALGQSALWPSSLPFGLRLPWYSPSVQLNRRMKAQIKGPFDDLNAAGGPFISEEAVHNGRSTLGLVDLRPLMMQGHMQQMMEQMKSMPPHAR
jgi:hypothetical protein